MGIVFVGQNIKNTRLNREGDGGEGWEEGEGGGGERGGERRGEGRGGEGEEGEGEGEKGEGEGQLSNAKHWICSWKCCMLVWEKIPGSPQYSGDRLETWLVQIFQPVVSRAGDTRDKLLVVKHLS